MRVESGDSIEFRARPSGDEADQRWRALLVITMAMETLLMVVAESGRRWLMGLIEGWEWSSYKGLTVDTLAHRGDEGRGYLR